MNVDQEKWEQWTENNQNEYGMAVIRYAERWADMMEAEMAEGEQLEAIAEDSSHEADTETISGFMYGCAVAILASCWQYGEQLRQWHNLRTQVHDEGERANRSGKVLNPALLCLAETECVKPTAEETLSRNRALLRGDSIDIEGL